MVEIPKEVFKHIRRIEIATTRLAEDLMVGAYHSAFKGKGMEFEEVREYVPGDDTRNIDWNVTARTGEPHIKNFREERELTVMLVVDVSASERFGSGNRLKSEFIAEIGAVLSFTAIKNNDNVGLLLFSDDVEAYIPPKKGLRHVLRIIRDLLIFSPKQKGSNLKEALDFLGRVQKKRCVCFLISDFMMPFCFKEMAVTAKRHDLIAIHIKDPAEESLPDMGLVSIKDCESDVESLIDTSDANIRENYALKARERAEIVNQAMKRFGAGYISLLTSEPYAPALRKFFRLRRIRH